MTTTRTVTLAERIDDCFRNMDFEALTELYDADVGPRRDTAAVAVPTSRSR